jgi:hypothetical protein
MLTQVAIRPPSTWNAPPVPQAIGSKTPTELKIYGSFYSPHITEGEKYTVVRLNLILPGVKI